MQANLINFGPETKVLQGVYKLWDDQNEAFGMLVGVW